LLLFLVFETTHTEPVRAIIVIQRVHLRTTKAHTVAVDTIRGRRPVGPTHALIVIASGRGIAVARKWEFESGCKRSIILPSRSTGKCWVDRLSHRAPLKLSRYMVTSWARSLHRSRRTLRGKSSSSIGGSSPSPEIIILCRNPIVWGDCVSDEIGMSHSSSEGSRKSESCGRSSLKCYVVITSPLIVGSNSRTK